MEITEIHCAIEVSHNTCTVDPSRIVDEEFGHPEAAMRYESN